MQFNSLVSASQLNKEGLLDILLLSQQIEKRTQQNKIINILNNYILSTLFFEPSTRTRLSFETAMHRLGGKVISTTGVQFSSLSKGETLYDTLKMIESYADICVIRHPVEGASKIAAKNLQIPIINGGDGAGEHPTQALLDIYTIFKHKNILEQEFTIAFVGDIKHGRTIRSLFKLLINYKLKFIFISPQALGLTEQDKSYLQKHDVTYVVTEDLSHMQEADIAYITRIQQERFLEHKEFEKYDGVYIINNEFLKKCKKDIIVMHPLPRLNEISTDIDETPNAVYFEQAHNGVYVRMALILKLLNKNLP